MADVEALGSIGLGAMPMSLAGRPSEEQSIATVHAALAAGVRLVDTADAYCVDVSDIGHNERLIARALRSWDGPTGDVVVATKGGHVRTANGGWALDGRPQHLRRACEASIRALGVEAIDLYQFHRPDPHVRFADSVGTLAELLAQGKIRAAGVSNVDVAQIDEARAIVPLTSVQNEFSPSFRSSLGELRHCADLGIAFLAWSPFGGITGARTLAERHVAFARVAGRHGVSPYQVVLAWERTQAKNVVPIPGASRPASIRDCLASLDLNLTDEDLTELDAA